MAFAETMDKKSSTKNQTFARFARYHTPYTGSILLAMACALVVAVCDLGAIQIFADTVNALKVVNACFHQRFYRLQ